MDFLKKFMKVWDHTMKIINKSILLKGVWVLNIGKKEVYLLNNEVLNVHTRTHHTH